MDSKEVFEHWSDWARTYGTSLRATTKTSTAKTLELDALERRIKTIFGDQAASVLEVGCGNGVNCFHLANAFKNLNIDGVDYIPDMIASAQDKLSANSLLKDRLRFFQGDATSVENDRSLRDAYNLVFTDRCLINLGSTETQIKTIASLASKIEPGGHLIMIENSLATYEKQNECRKYLGLEARIPAGFNHFFEEDKILRSLPNADLELVETEDFSSLHDLVLYALVPAINGGTVDYDHPLVHAATALSKCVSGDLPSIFGPFGQNRLFCCRRTG